MKTNPRLYTELTTQERFLLTMEAFGRLDVQEIDRLQATMVESTYRMSDPSYWRRVQVATTAATLYGMWRNQALACGLATICAITSEAFDDDDEQLCRLSDVVRAFASKVKAYDSAWDAFCEYVGIDAATLLKAGHIDLMEPIADLLGGVADHGDCVDENLRDEARAMFESVWDNAVRVGH